MSAPKITELGTQSIRSLLMKYALPGIIAMTASSLYNMVDSIFIGHGVGAMALSGLTVAKPFMDICAAFGTLVGVGASSLVAIKLGEKDYRSANDVLANVILLNVLLGALVMAVGLYWLDPILYAFGASDVTIAYAREYMEIILWGNILTHIYYGLNSMLRSIGHPKIAMYATILAVVVNIILDPIFIFVLDMGVRGAALATMISQLVSVIIELVIFLNPKEVIYFHRGIWRLKRDITMRALGIGTAPFLMHMASCFVVLLINNQLRRYGDQMGEGVGDLAIGAYGIVNRIIFFFVMVVLGFTQGMQPIAGYNYGAGKFDRVLKVFWQTVGWATLCTTLAFLVGVFAPKFVVSLFANEPTMIDIAAKGFTIAVAMFPFVGIGMVASNFFQSIGKPRRAIALSVTRQVIFLVPLLIFMPRFFGIEGVWYCMPIADVASAILAAVLLVIQVRKLRQNPDSERAI